MEKFEKHLLQTIIVSILVSSVLTWISLEQGQKYLLFNSMMRLPFWDTVFLIELLQLSWYLFPKKIAWMIMLIMDAIILLLSIINELKIQKLDEPLILQDLYLINEAFALAKEFVTNQILIGIIAIVLILIVVLVFIIKKLPKENLSIKIRLLISFLSVFLLILGANIPSSKVWAYMGLFSDQKDPITYEEENGFAMGIYMQIATRQSAKPDGYTTEKAQQLVKENSQPIYPLNKKVKPNIIVIQLEAFSDPTELKGVTFNQDPIPFFRSLQQQYTGGTMGVSVFGGGTANSEFETLTSMSMKNIPYDTIAFTTEITHPTLSTAWTLREKDGYAATGVHDHYEWFYNRYTVYPDLGLHPNTFREQMAGNQNFPFFATDDNLVKYIIQHTKQSKGKDFVMAVSVESHGPYLLDKVPNQPVQITGTPSGLSEEGKNAIQNYTNEIHNVDNELKALFDYYQNSKQPTVIAMYGDHKPWLGDNRKYYYETGSLTPKDNLQNYQYAYRTPLVIWNNYLNQGHKDMHLGTSFLMPYILQEVGIQGNPIQTFLQKEIAKGVTEMPIAPYQKTYGWDAKSLQDYAYLQYYYMQQVQK